MSIVAYGGLVNRLQEISALTERFNPPVVARAKIVRGTIKTNHAYCPLKFLIVNQRKSPIDGFKNIFNFENENVKFIKNNVEKKMFSLKSHFQEYLIFLLKMGLELLCIELVLFLVIKHILMISLYICLMMFKKLESLGSYCHAIFLVKGS